MSASIRTSVAFGLLLGGAAVCTASEDLTFEEIRRQLLDARSRVLRSAGTMTVTTKSVGLIVGNVEHPSWTENSKTWAFWGHRTLSQSNEYDQVLIDGGNRLSRSRNGDRFFGRIDRANLSTLESPLHFGYKISRFEGAVSTLQDLWLCDLLRFMKPGLRRLADGRIELTFLTKTSTQDNELRIIVSPNHGWMMDESILKKTYRTTGRFVQVLESLAKSSEAIKVGEIWLPKSFYFATRQPPGQFMKTTVITISNLKEEVDQSRFTNFFKPGDFVRDRSEWFEVQADGSFIPAARGSRRSAGFVTEYVKWVGGLAGAIVLAFALFKGMAFVKAKKA